MTQEISEGFRLSPQQLHLWDTWEQMGTEGGSSQLCLRIEGPLNRKTLQAAIDRIVSDHEILRVTFRTPAGRNKPQQFVIEDCSVTLTSVEIDARDEAGQSASVEACFLEQRKLAADSEMPLSATLLGVSETSSLLCLTLPALCADRTTLGILARELGVAYEAISSGKSRPEPELQYVDLAEWLHGLLEEEDAAVGKSFWQKRRPLADHPGTRLPFQNHHRVQPFSPGTLERTIERARCDAPRELLQACWHLLTSRLTGKNQVVVHMACDGRRYEDLQNVPGPFTKYLPVNGQLTPGLAFEDFAQQISDALDEASQWQEYYVWQGVGEEKRSGTPAFGFELEITAPPFRAGDITLEQAHSWVFAEPFQINLTCRLEVDRLRLVFHYDKSLFSDEAVATLSEQYITLLTDAVARRSVAVEALRAMSDAERERLLVTFNDTDTGDEPSKWIPHLFEEQATRMAERDALVFDLQAGPEARLSYADLARRSDALARYLATHGVTRETRVGVCMERSIDMVVVLLAVLKAGGAYVPLDPGYPKSRLIFVAGDAKLDLLLSQRKWFHLYQDTDLTLVDVAEAAKQSPPPADSPLIEVTSGDQLAYVIYTSGSTGRPKGVMISHAAFLNHMLWMKRCFQLDERDRFMQKAPISFDASVWELFLPLILGAQLVVARPEGQKNAQYLIDLIRTRGITVFQSVPSLLEVLLEHDDFLTSEPLRYLFSAGEALSVDLVGKVLEDGLAETFVNMYGPTEATIDVTYWVCEPNPPARTIPIGRPLDNTRMYALDDSLEPVPMSTEGRLFIGGTNLARGYLNRPGLTAERFIPDPHGRRPGERIYDTGDLGRFLPGGELEFLGRRDHQVKFHGFRIELDEIEAVLRSAPGLERGLVVHRDDREHGSYLAAYLVPDKHSPESVLTQLDRDGLLAGKTRFTLPNGMPIVHQNRKVTEYAYNEIWKDACYLRNGITINDGDCIFDVGANIGLFTLFAGKQAKDVSIYSFEPIPDTYEHLRLNVQIHGIDAHAFNRGVGRSSGEEVFTFYPELSTFSGRMVDADSSEERNIYEAVVRNTLPENQEVSEETLTALMDQRLVHKEVTCQMTTISEMIREQNIERIDLLKIDVEKSERDALAGIEDSDWPKIQQIVLEVHDKDGALEEILLKLNSLGFETSYDQDHLLEKTELYNVYGRRGTARANAPVTRAVEAPNLTAETRKVHLIGETRLYLESKLPSYMVPSQFVVLEEIPLTPNGKVDRNALPSPIQAEAKRAVVLPRTPEEKVLAKIWARLLGMDQVSVDDNFFEIGGDSIISIMAASRARKKGYHFLPGDLFKHETIEKLARVMTPIEDSESASAKKPPVESGEIPLLPIQHWFFDREPVDPGHWNQSFLFRVPGSLEHEALVKAAKSVIACHAALRMRFEETDAGRRQVLEPASAAPYDEIILREDYTAVPEPERAEALEQRVQELQQQMDLSRGLLMRLVLFDYGPETEGRLFIVIHHLATDGLSWRILLEQLATAYEKARKGERLRHDSDTTIAAWARKLTEHAQSQAVREELPYWRALGEKTTRPIPTDHERSAEDNLERHADTVQTGMTEAETRALLQDVPAAYRTEINDVLLTALVTAFGRWTGDDRLLLDLEGHGREDVFGIDVSQTVGWFPSLYPVCLEPADPEPGAALKSVKETLRAIPNKGVGFGLLRYLSEDTEVRETMAALPRPDVSFNYLGQVDQTLSRDEDSLLSPASESTGTGRGPAQSRPYLLDLTAIVSDGRLHLNCTYSNRLHNRETIETLCGYLTETLRELIHHCTRPGTGGLTPSDVPESNLDQKALDALSARVQKGTGSAVETVYPLSPIQQAALFHTMMSPGSGVYILQRAFDFVGIDVPSLKEAWARIIRHYPVFRTLFLEMEQGDPVQVVLRDAPLPLREEDWSGLDEPEIDARLEALMTEDRARGFDLGKPPLMRFTLIRLDARRSIFVWSHHHILLDGWSNSLILENLLPLYEAVRAGREFRIPHAEPYQSYIRWLLQQDPRAADTFWRDYMKGFERPTRFGFERDRDAVGTMTEAQKEIVVTLSDDAAEKLQELTRKENLTLNIVAQTAWALLLNQYSGERDIVFGSTVSGRPPELEGMEKIVGPFINTIPVRARIDEEDQLITWMKDLHEDQSRRNPYSYTSLGAIKRQTDIDGGLPVLESVVVVINYPVSAKMIEHGENASFSVKDRVAIPQNSMPITVTVSPLETRRLLLRYDSNRFEDAAMETVLSRYKTLMEAIVASPQSRLGDLSMIGDTEKRQREVGRRKRKKAKFDGLRTIERDAVDLSAIEPVIWEQIGSANLPHLARPAEAGTDLFSWAEKNRNVVQAKLHNHGALLFRGFGIDSVPTFEKLAKALCPVLLEGYGDLPPQPGTDKVYFSTPYPPDKRILFHNESSHMHCWPLEQLFACMIPAETGGETPLVDCREVYKNLDPRLIALFEEKKLTYVRNFIEGLDVSWQQFFKTSEKSVVEAKCRERGMELEWFGEELRVRKHCLAITTHPKTGDKVFFNQIQLHHTAFLDPDERASLLAVYPEDKLPRNVTFGDGTPIEDSIVEEVLACYDALAVRIPWEKGDVIMLDNMLTAHGRDVFTGDRKIVVAMGEIIGASNPVGTGE